MKRIFERYHLQIFAVLTAATIVMCAWQNPAQKQTMLSNNTDVNDKDTMPEDYHNKVENNIGDLDKAMKELDIKMADLDVQMKNININIDKEINASIAKINTDEIEKQTEVALKQIDWAKMQADVDKSMAEAQKEVAKIDFTKMQNQMKDLQQKLQSEEFKSHFDSAKLHQQINDAMSKAKESIAAAKIKLQQMKDFTDALAADNLIDKKKGYTIEWKNGDLIINGKEQPKNVSDKYRKYETTGEIKMQPEDTESF